MIKFYKRTAIIITIAILISLSGYAQLNIQSSIEAQTTIAPANKMPFWFRSDQYGSIPPAGTSGAFIGSVYKPYDSTQVHGFNWSAGIQGRINVGSQSNITLIEAYIKVKKGIFALSAGRTRDVTGIVDTSLSSGSFSISGNALGIPKVSFGIPEYYGLPFFNKLFSIKLNYSFGYFGTVDIGPPGSTLVDKAVQYYQENEIYGRLGRNDWKLKLFAGINHHVEYGNEQEIYGPFYKLSGFQQAIYAAIGKTFHADKNHDSYLGGKVGNHIGSVDFGGEYDFSTINVMGYHQFIYDVGALAHLANISDGITGISISNKTRSDNTIRWQKFLLEFIATKNQAGGLNSKSLSGDEDYYNDYEFDYGWSYMEANLGNPLLTSRKYTRTNLLTNPMDYIIDNRILGIHTGLQASVNQINITMKLTYTRNYGTYGTSIYGHSTGTRFYPTTGVFTEVNQFSGYLGLNKNLKNNVTVGAALALDKGMLYYNSAGLLLSIKKYFD